MSVLQAAARAARPEGTRRYEAKRERIVDAASRLIDEHGVRGLSLASVAAAIGLGNTGIAYYFRRREDLAAACFERALDVLEQHIRLAGEEPDLARRIRKLIALRFETMRDARRGSAHPVARLTDLRSTDDPMRASLLARYFGIFRQARAFHPDPPPGEEARLAQLMRTHVLLDNLYFLPVWIDRHECAEWGRIEEHLARLLETGMAPGKGGRLDAPTVAMPAERDDPGERFLTVATELINERGYRGTSVELISSRLNVTKGSFYHHLDAKDDLILMCFERSLSSVSDVLERALRLPGNRLQQLIGAVSTLLTIQLSDRSPLVRTTALLALPSELRTRVLEQSDRIERRISGMISDAVIDGSMMPVDPLLASKVVLATINAAYDLRERAARVGVGPAVRLYGSTLFDGLLAPPP